MGWTFWPPPHIYLRCGEATVRLKRPYVTVFAHELIHVEHPGWPHSRVYPMSRWYAPVVERVIRRVKRRYP